MSRPTRPTWGENGDPCTSVPLQVKLGTQPALVYLHAEPEVGELVWYKLHPWEPWDRWLTAYVHDLDPIPFLEKM